ncbi:MAG TPA: hypothetical protein VK306_03690 [Acidimicrobiales bacterium]|nr:hypothetical protein [Acidimicrobiales bacterium]
MTTVETLSEDQRPTSVDAVPRAGALVYAGLTSLGAGALHATAVGVHSAARQAAIAFAVLAAFQIGWGIAAVVRPWRWLGAVGAVGNTVAVGGWYLSKTSGISFVDGLEAAEGVEFADAIAAGFAAIAVVLGLVWWLSSIDWARHHQEALLGTAAIVVAAVSAWGMVAASSDEHDHGGAGHDDGTEEVDGHTDDHSGH